MTAGEWPVVRVGGLTRCGGGEKECLSPNQRRNDWGETLTAQRLGKKQTLADEHTIFWRGKTCSMFAGALQEDYGRDAA